MPLRKSNAAKPHNIVLALLFEGTTIEGILAAGEAVFVGLFFLFSVSIAYRNVVLLSALTP